MTTASKLWIVSVLLGVVALNGCKEVNGSKKSHNGSPSPGTQDSSKVSDIEARSKAGSELAFALDLPQDYVNEEAGDASQVVAEEDSDEDVATSGSPGGVSADSRRRNDLTIRCAAPGKSWFGYLSVRLDKAQPLPVSDSPDEANLPTDSQSIPVPPVAEGTVAELPLPPTTSTPQTEGSVAEVLGLSTLSESPDSNWVTYGKARAPINCHEGLQLVLNNLTDGSYRLTADIFGMKKHHAFSGVTDIFEVKGGAVDKPVSLRMNRVKREPRGKVAVNVEWEDYRDDKEERRKLCEGFYATYQKAWAENEGLPAHKLKGVNGRCLSIMRVHGVDLADGKAIPAQFRIVRASGEVPPQKWLKHNGHAPTRLFYVVPGVYSVSGHAAGYHPNISHQIALRPGEIVDFPMKFKLREQPSRPHGEEVAEAVRKCHSQNLPYNFATKACHGTAKLLPFCSDPNFRKIIQENLKPLLEKGVAEKFDSMWKEKVEVVMESGGYTKVVQCFYVQDQLRFGVNFTTADGSEAKTVYVQTEKAPH